MSLKKLGRYDLLRVIGKGAMGLVYEGRDPNLDRRVAIKTIKVENLSEEAAAEYEARFRTEARSAARLQHPNIVSVYDSDRDGDTAFLVMEYVEGEDLKHHLDQGFRYSLEQAVGIMRDLLAALEYAHSQNVVHRDIKPANLLIEGSGRIKLTDFGVARIQDSGESTRTQGSMVGTLKYMSPEQVQGLTIDARADLFSAGIVLYQLLTGARPFDGENDFAIIHQIINHHPAAPSSFNTGLPREVDAVVARALAKSRDARFATAREFADALQAALRQADDTTIVPPPGLPRTEGRSFGSASLRTILSPSPGPEPSRSGSNPTVTQELELVFWKDIKDSVDPQDLALFLDKFPAGIYADLAQRRLARLKDASLGSSTATAAPGAFMEGASAVPQTGQPPTAASASGIPGADLSAAPSLAEKWRAAGLMTQVLAGLGVLVVLVAGARLLGGRSEQLPEPTSLAAPAQTAPAESPSKEASATTLQKTASTTNAALTRKPVVKPAPAKAPVQAQAAAQAEKVDKAEAPKPVAKSDVPAATSASGASTAAKPAQTSPKDACADRVLLGYLLCMAEQCEKPVFVNHPVCVERREMERRTREEQKRF
ncbi:MAG: protein kinase [Gammaproteobacteria bacterium]|nr:protein kinase [Gammaproteobacteria bacterium]MBU0787630.1 protein kinase [Gammaproteobacteria bacterium]MBU0814900.1 protein kinase [Gammaproteobacteria bacterium]MBU1785992.1 protein kinase [Gammaproteobacteria bacterium]